MIFFVGREAFSPVWSEGQVVQMGPGDQASQGGPGGQVVRWSGGQVVRWLGGQVVLTFETFVRQRGVWPDS